MTETGMELDNMKEIVDEFMIEADEIIAKLDEDMVKLEKNSSDLNLLNEIFRAAHTIKGTSGFLGLDKVSELTHKMEDVLNKLRKGELTTNAVIMDALLQAIDTLKLLLEDLRTGKDSGIDLASVKNQLIAASSATTGSGAPTAKKETKKAGKSPATEISVAITPATSVEPTTPKTELPISPAEPLPADSPELKLDEAEPVEEEKEPTGEAQKSDGGASLAKQMAEMRRGADQTIRVDVGRLDSLMNIMGELVLGRNAMLQLTGRISSRYEGQELIDDLNQVATQLNFVTTELQMSVMKMRMLPVGKVFNKFPRVVRDLARNQKKEIDLLISGEETELDKSVIEEIGDPLVHLIRNSADHGIELPDERVKAGKPRLGRIDLIASQEGSNIVIKVVDDGAGLDTARIRQKAIEKKLAPPDEINRMSDKEVFSYIFHPGFSTAKVVTDVSGRGVGMDVVRTNIEKLKGIIDIQSERGKGTAIIIKLPLTLAIVQGLLVEACKELFILPLASVLETVKIARTDVASINRKEVIRLRDTVLPIVDLHSVFFKGTSSLDLAKMTNSYVVVLGLAEKRIGLVVDHLIGQEEVVIKSLGEFLGQTQGIAGATILGDGRVRLIVDPAGIFAMMV
jgi:two-component system, chemotaxis family, sensor kinase CheA